MSTKEPKGIRESIRDATREIPRGRVRAPGSDPGPASGAETRPETESGAMRGDAARSDAVRDAIRPVYGPRAVRASAEPPLAAPSDPGRIPPAAERDGLPSTARANRRFRSLALGGFALVLVLSATGLWWVATLAF